MTVDYQADQLVIFAEPRARRRDPVTSHEAAAKVKPGHQGRLLRVERIVEAAGMWGATADEVHNATRAEDGNTRARSTWHKAVSDAAKSGLIVPHPLNTKRLSIFGSYMVVYVASTYLGERNG